jgi:hypothetical protein
MIPIKKDKKLFIHINYNIINNSDTNITKKFINFIDVPKRYQLFEENVSINENENIE